MKKALLQLSLLAVSAPAHATGGLVCRTAGARPIEVAVGFGHVAGSPLISARLLDNGRNVPVSRAQWWLDQSEVRLLLVDPQASQRELILRARRSGQVYDGNLWRGGHRRWVRCREG
jgi:hypothetical protein